MFPVRLQTRTLLGAIGTLRLCADTVAKVFLGDERKFLEPLMRFIRGDVRDHIVSSKIDHGPP
jgi:hypothetical protein